MAKHSKRKPRANKSRRITIRLSDTEYAAISRRAAARNLTLSEFIISRPRGDGVSVNWITKAEWRQVAIACEAYGQLLIVAMAHARTMQDQATMALLVELVANNGSNQANLELILDAILVRLQQHDAQSNSDTINKGGN